MLVGQRGSLYCSEPVVVLLAGEFYLFMYLFCLDNLGLLKYKRTTKSNDVVFSYGLFLALGKLQRCYQETFPYFCLSHSPLCACH